MRSIGVTLSPFGKPFDRLTRDPFDKLRMQLRAGSCHLVKHVSDPGNSKRYAPLLRR